jgi:NO-binding membrane sensor protein with MHYT domain/signal transduction histidine kinase
MYRVLACLTEQHDYRLVALAALICVIASFTAFRLFDTAMSNEGKPRRTLILLTGLTTAVGIWSTHFVGMLAFDPGLPVHYNIPLTIISLIITIGSTTMGFAILARDGLTNTLSGGLVIGLGISVMHFTGMKSLIVGGQISWERRTILVALVIGIFLSMAAGLVFQRRDRYFKLAATILLVLAICSMHFIGMGAATFTFDPTLAETTMPFDRISLVFLVAAVDVFAIIACVLASIMGRFTIARGMVGFGAAVTAALVTVSVIGTYAFEQLRIGSDSYNRIVNGKELVADVLPPPSFIIEAYLAADQARERPDIIDYHAGYLATLKQSYIDRREHWRKSNDLPKSLKLAITETSDAPVMKFWSELETVFLPALMRRDQATIETSMRALRSHFLQHRVVIDSIVSSTNKHVQTVEHAAQIRGTAFRDLLFAAMLMLFAILAAAIQTVRHLLVAPVLETARYLGSLANGSYHLPTPFAHRRDEIGLMAKAIETLRLGSVEKQRLEADAVETRRTNDHAQAQRAKDRAAETMRLNLANENITSLNKDLSQTIAKLQHAQDENLRKGRLAQLGQLTATVAHEIRNPLGSIKTAAYLIDRKTKGKDLNIDPPMRRIHNGIQRCDNIITELLDFTRIKPVALSEHVADEWIKTIIDEERINISSDIAIILKLMTGDELVRFDPSSLRRVLVNLLSNAAEAMIGRDNEPGAEPIENPTIVISSRTHAGNLEITISDNGPGISEANLLKIRQPLFTTKSFGIGLGLPAVENILEQHGGGLRIESTLGYGATLTAWFPITTPADEPKVENFAAVAA